MGWFGDMLSRSRSRRDYAEMDYSAAGDSGEHFPARPRVVETGGMPRFRATATDQLHGFRGGPLGQARVKLRDAFTPAQPIVEQSKFAGRTDVLTTLIRSIEDQKLHVVLYGDRGIGKTSLLHVLAKLAEDARYIVHYTSCGETSDFDETFRAVAAGVPLLYHRDYSPKAVETEEGAKLSGLLPPTAVTTNQVSDLLAKLTGTRLLIILDEFDRSSPGAFRRQVAELIKNLSDRSIRVQLVIAGVASNLTELVEHIPSIRRNILGLQVPSMSNAEVEELIRIGERASGVTFEASSVELIADVASGSPYLASVLAQHAAIAAVDRGELAVARDDVVLAVRRVTDEIGDRISVHSRFEIERARQGGGGELMGRLGRAALRNGGRLNEDVLRDLAPEASGAGRSFDRLHGEHRLVERLENDPGHRYCFREEGVPVYLWLLLTRDLLAGARDATRPAYASGA